MHFYIIGSIRNKSWPFVLVKKTEYTVYYILYIFWKDLD